MLSTRSWEPKSPRDLLIGLMEQYPDCPKNNLFAKFQAALKINPELQRPVDWYFFCEITSIAVVKKVATPLNVEKERRELSAKLRNRVLLDALLPNGKRLREATFRECSEAGGWFARIAAMGEPSQIVGEHLTEMDLPNLEI